MLKSTKKVLFEEQAEVAKALAHPLRIAIIDFLKDGPQCVCDIAEYVGAERSNVSRHLSVMVNTGILASHKQGLKVIYQLTCPCIMEFFACISGVLKEQAARSNRLLKALK